MRKEKNAIFILTLILIVIVALRLVSETYSRYINDFYADGTSFNVATWKFEEDNPTKTIELNLLDTADHNKLVNGKAAPGTSGDFTVTVSNENSEVVIDYEITFSEKPSNFTITADDSAETGRLNMGETKTVSFHWEWLYYTTDLADNQDTEVIGENMNMKMSITGRQVIAENN